MSHPSKSTPSDYLALASKTLDRQGSIPRESSERLDESYGYLFTGLALLLPVLQSHTPSNNCFQRDDNGAGRFGVGGLVIGTRKKRDKKGKGRMVEEPTCINPGLTGGDMVVLVSLTCFTL
jgi:hypothetical protein